MRCVKVAIVATTMAWAGTAASGDGEFRQAVNYVFSGNPEGKKTSASYPSKHLDILGCIT
jgi:hypothetical protein